MGQPSGDEVDFGSLSERRKLALATFDLCAICALPFGDELRWQVAFQAEAASSPAAVYSEAPLHEICGLYAAQVCPFVSSPHARLGDQWRKGERRPEVLLLIGYRRTQKVYGEPSLLQPGTGVLHFEMSDPVRSYELHTADEAARAYSEALRAERSVATTSDERRLADLLCNPTPKEGEDSGAVMAGAAWYVGAAFCPGVRDVQGMGIYVDGGSYLRIAAHVLSRPEAAKEMAAEIDDQATRAAMNWLVNRARLPRVLEQWRRGANGRMSSVRSQVAAAQMKKSPANSRKNKRKSEAASRRKNRN
ncbi:hypothetical protein [Amycolatopsis sp. NPDC004079]|uniref:hypothetical protein n=1 Tax=Amycolatopsis sp. NPDC004079 TaxID=3154549 RepID=UPI0033B7C37C